MKYTLFLTHRCNLACEYCYVSKSNARMAPGVADTVIDFAFSHTPPEEDIDIGFFGGEPLLEFPHLTEIVRKVQARPAFDPCRVKFGMATNGTLLTPEILDFLRENQVLPTISCDGPPAVHDRFRRSSDGFSTSARVERGIRLALERLEHVPVNAVYRPETFESLPETIDYFASLGVREIYLNPDLSARWTREDAEKIPAVFESLGQRFKQSYRDGHPLYISLIDVKITVLLRGGYQPSEHCHMGEREFAFTASGRVLPCERLAAADPEEHSIGTANGMVQISPLRNHFAPGPPVQAVCASCSLADYCANWCGCSNYFMSGYYNRVSPFFCASERASIELALDSFRTLEAELGPTFVEHLGGHAQMHSRCDSYSGKARVGHPAHFPVSPMLAG
jgi:uncharacterized protein